MSTTPHEAAEVHWANRERLPMWTITAHPSDFIQGFVARMSLTLPSPKATDCALYGESLQDVRSMLPPGLVCIDRDPNDDPVIVEVWL